MFDRYPTFPQRQLIHGFAQWMGFSGGEGERLLCGPDQFSQRFPDWLGDKLPANTCWEYVYREVFTHLVGQALEHAAAKENAAFTGAVPKAKRLLHQVWAHWHESEAPIRAFLIQQHGDCPAYLPRLIGLLNCLLHQHDSACRYTAVNDHRSLVAELATLVWLLYRIGGEQAVLQVNWRDPVLAFELTGQTLDSHLRMFVNDGRDRQHGRQPAVSPARAPVALHLCLGANGSRARAEAVRLFLMEDSIRMPVDVVHLAWRHLFPEDMPIQSALHDIPERLKDAMRHPGKFLRRAEPSLRRRPYLKEIQP